jgi:hypothetical protein
MTTITPSERREARLHRRHIIEEVRFQQAADMGLPSSAAPLLCSCSEEVTSGTWNEHRGVTPDQERVNRNRDAWNARQEEAA